MFDVTRDLQTPPFCKLPYFLRLLPPLERKVHGRKYMAVKHLQSVIQ